MIALTAEQAKLLIDLLEAHRTNLQGHLAAVDAQPGLALVADALWGQAEQEVALIDELLEQLGTPELVH